MSSSLITGGTFTTVNGYYIVNPPEERRRINALMLLKSNIAAGALHDSAERYDPPKCHPQTRESWVQQDSAVHPFLWLYGPAGSGKSSIAQSIAEILYGTEELAATFFFSGTAAGRNDDRHLIPTIAYQLTTFISQTTDYIVDAIDQDSLIFTKSLKSQVDALIKKPLSELAFTMSDENAMTGRSPMLVIIDGLDECSEGQRRILDALLAAVQDSSVPLCFFIASRPEHDIRKFFNQENVESLSRRLVLDDKYQPNKDIDIFLRSRFDRIKQEHPSGPHLPSSWPSDSDIQLLVQKASGQFIYASTVMKFVESPRHWPTDRLDIILGLASPGITTPFADLDTLYYHVFSSVEDIERVMDTFIVLLFMDSKLSSGMSAIEAFLCFRRGELQIILNDLHSIISVPMLNSDAEEPRLFHASVGDFLLDKSRSKKFFIDPSQAEERLTRHFIKHMGRFITQTPQQEHLNSTLLKVSCSGLLTHCLLVSHPSRALLQDLYAFNFERYLDMLSMVCNSGTLAMSNMGSLPSLSRWIGNQHPIHAHFNHHVISRLSQYPECPSSFRLFTAATLTSFPSHRITVFDMLSKGTSEYPNGLDLEGPDTVSLRLRFPYHQALNGYYNMVNVFLMDATNAGIYHVDESKYRDLAKFFVDSLAESHTQEVEECSLDLLDDIFSCSDKDSELAKYLQDNVISSDLTFVTQRRRKKLWTLVESYLEECGTSDNLVVEIVPPPITSREVSLSTTAYPSTPTPASATSAATANSLDSAFPFSERRKSKRRQMLGWFKRNKS
ncbi:hypothetical protein CPB84DRAFT_1781728 [Gymnopilus junonius]|uniref:Nephrocystin 3-like N-terminal domain-containing protein n=1 Tax=Gymnopilus junonius TaxID=109634 RepID=A0A9P5NKR0_GYMJU|nr:hypothetical protein CPB84DRAFT_1781728 [Gymnopilus junonius]